MYQWRWSYGFGNRGANRLQASGIEIATQLILRDESTTALNGLDYLEENLVFYLYAPLTSCEIERLFSLLKWKLKLANDITVGITETIWSVWSSEFIRNECFKITFLKTFLRSHETFKSTFIKLSRFIEFAELLPGFNTRHDMKPQVATTEPGLECQRIFIDNY